MFNDAERSLLEKNEFKYDVVGEKQSITETKQRLQVAFDKEVAELPKKEYFDGVDIDTTMRIQTGCIREAQRFSRSQAEAGLIKDDPEKRRRKTCKKLLRNFLQAQKG